jgi:hypothetical protein
MNAQIITKSGVADSKYEAMTESLETSCRILQNHTAIQQCSKSSDSSY